MNNDGPKIAIVIIIVAIVLGLVIMECSHSRTFYGRLNDKTCEINYAYDEERTVMHTDDDGNVTIEIEGDDSTTAIMSWKLNFFSDGEVRSINVKTVSYTVYRRGNNAEQEALNMLKSTYEEPPLYTHTKPNKDYIVKVSGWLADGSLEDVSLPKVE
jgi:hypothetical protein